MIGQLKYISSNEIDNIKWDRCIDESLNGIVFAYSWFLDSVCSSWDALILNDYEAVFPVTRYSKFGIHYFFNPIFALQLGVFSKNVISEEVMLAFIKAIPSKIKLIDIQLNFGNILSFLQSIQIILNEISIKLEKIILKLLNLETLKN